MFCLNNYFRMRRNISATKNVSKPIIFIIHVCFFFSFYNFIHNIISVVMSVMTNNRWKVKIHPCTGTEALYRAYGL